MLDQPQLWFQDVWGHFCIGRNQTEDHLMPSLISWLRTLRRKYGGVWIIFEVARMESGWCQREKPVKTGCNGDPSILGRSKFAYSVFTPFYSIFAPFSAISSLQIENLLGGRHSTWWPNGTLWSRFKLLYFEYHLILQGHILHADFWELFSSSPKIKVGVSRVTYARKKSHSKVSFISMMKFVFGAIPNQFRYYRRSQNLLDFD